MRSPRPIVALLAPIGLAALAACAAPRARALRGAPAPARFPEARLPDTSQRIVFQWRASDNGLVATGEGVARLAPPDSARLDLFLGGGMGSLRAVLIGDTVRAPGGDAVRRVLPPPAMLWAGVGRLAVPPASDTVARVAGDTLRADIGRDPAWRVTFVADRLARLERVQSGRVAEWIARSTSGDVRYRHEGAGRSLDLKVTRTEAVPNFDASIWNP